MAMEEAVTEANEAKEFHNGFCEVCQKDGRVLFCENCTRAFHVACIEKFVDLQTLGIQDRWVCPVCVHGPEVLLRGYKKPQLAEEQMEDLMMKQQRECKRIASASVRNRDRTFLKAIDDVAPFASRPALRRIQNSEAKASRVRMPQILDDDSDGSVSAVPDVRTLDPQSHTPEMYKDVLAEGIRLKKYQAEGVGWMIQGFFDRCGGILADDMGLGKTLMTLCFLSYLKVKEQIPGPALVVVPLSCAGNWLREARKFVPHLSIAKVCGNSKEKSLSLDDNEIWFGMKDIIVTTYETVANIENYFGRMFWKAVILDEAHRAKNSASRIREALEETHSACRILLTGTPLQNSLKELHALLKFLWPDVLAKQSEMFENAIQLPELAGKADPNSKACINQVMVDKIRGLLALSMKRRKKEDVLSLPPKIFHDVWLPMSPLQVQWYRRILSLKNTQMSRDIRSLKKLILRLRNVCIHPRLAVASKEDEEFLLSMGVCSQDEIDQLKDGPLVSEEVIGESYKLAFVDALLTHLHAQNMGLNDNWRKTFEARTKQKDAKKKSASAWLKNASGPLFLDDMKYHRMQLEGGKEHAGFLDGMEDVDWDTPQPHKALIFCQHQVNMDFLEEYCKFRGYRYMRMDGSTNRVLRELDMRDFNALDEDVFIYLISTRAGGLGVNLASANHVIIFEQDWNPHVDHQAIDRAHRIGQSRQVHIHRPILEWAVEERLLIRSNAKLEMEKNIIGDRVEEDDEKEDPEEPLDAEEIMSILNNGESAFKVFEGETFSFDLEEYFDRKRAPMPEVKDRSPLRPPKRPAEAAPPPVPDDVMRSGSGRVVTRKLTFAEEFCTAPMKTRKKTDVIKLKHIPKCFTCGVKDERPLQECACCPMSHHVQCVGHTPKKWTCPWHYCSSCSRSANQVGGMLIHCLECPTALCYDCFPPDFRRVYPPDRFWDEMKKRGWNVTSAKMAFFKCNSCRTLEEQQKRLKMRAEDLAVQQDAEKKAALEEKRNLAAVKKRKMDEEAQRRMQEYKVQHQQQRVAEEISHWRARLERTAEKLWPQEFRRIWQHHVKNNQKEIGKAMVGRTVKMPSVEFLMRSLETCDKCGNPCHKGRNCPFESESPTKGVLGSKSFTLSLTPEKRAERMAIFKELEAAMRKEKPVPEPEIKDLKETTPAWQIVEAYRAVEAAFKAKVLEFTSRISAKLVVPDKCESASGRQMNALQAAKASAAAALARKEKAAAKQVTASKAAEVKRNAAQKAAERAAEVKKKAAERAADEKRSAAQKAAQKQKLEVSAPQGKTSKSAVKIRYIDSGPGAGWHVKGRAYPSTITMWLLPPNASVWQSRAQALKELEGSDPTVIEAIDKVRWQVQQELKGPPVAEPSSKEGTRKKLRLSWSHHSSASSSSSVRMLS
ncbi:isw-1 [Symbiodinium necroappetens]|uniref:Isw-1 protein n=1 Tax=Symbiodinium necroappetens TaxID=1628268 RepID=A0A812X768_9DINO|nr:isw-1 [Symbiodinium necroappetens]